MWQGYKNFDHMFTYDQFDEFWNEVSKLTSFPEVRKSENAIRYINWIIYNLKVFHKFKKQLKRNN